ncbi:hypothetical protein DFJ58DRAFT_846521 [Suillus subalutaceus]|uniref:uncharacterized protein n=1 Tax=Suillus subalutaceus TaxID=48586 RepID=UPI001B86EFB4|nr:uncharacterized protein DFJ58DRAFT_846521 [Suillus subalutaceus]KAG1837307.1 hypothetical protein DFJ58DRAFT_846521 [Suillus subalutaceus]
MTQTSLASAGSTPDSTAASSDDEASSTGNQPVIHPDPTQPMLTSSKARAKHRIAALEEELATMRQENGGKQRKTTFYVAQGRAIRRLVILYHNLEDLIAENDRRQDRSQRGYIECSRLKKGADAARGNNTSSLKELVATWVNQEFRLSPLIKPNDKHLRGFASDICGKLLCPAEWHWGNDSVKVGIHNRTSEYIVSENSWPLFVYENYQVNRNNLEEGFLKSKLLVLPSSHHLPQQGKLKVMVMELIFSRIAGAPSGNLNRRRLKHVSL